MKPMLAGKFVEEKLEKKLPVYGQTKYDGIRVFIRDGYAYTRSLKPVRNQELQSWVRHNSDFLEGLDGEIICGDPTAEDCYRRTMQFVMTYDAQDEFTFYVFDKWDEPSTFEDRLALVDEITAHFIMSKDKDKITSAPTEMLWSMEDVWEFHDKHIQEGHEGVILRDPHAFYKYGRGTPVQCQCIKMKEGGWTDTEVSILGFHEEMHNANEATINALGYTEHSGHKEGLVGKGTLGAIEVSGTFEDGRPFTCRVGTGLDHATRQAVWDDPDAYRDRLVKMKYFTVGIKDKPRFPTFLGFRDKDDLDPPKEEQMDLFG